MFQHCEQKSSSKSSDSRSKCIVIGCEDDALWSVHFISYHITYQSQHRPEHYYICLNLRLSLDSEGDFCAGYWNVSHYQQSFSGPPFHQDNKITSRYAMITSTIAKPFHTCLASSFYKNKNRNVSCCLVCPFHWQVQPSHALLQAKTLKLIYLNFIFSKHFYYTMGNILLTNTQRGLTDKI